MSISNILSSTYFQTGIFDTASAQPVANLFTPATTISTTTATGVTMVDISSLGNLLSVASTIGDGILQSAATSPNGFATLVTAAQLFVDAFNNFLQVGLDDSQNPAGGLLAGQFLQELNAQTAAATSNGKSLIDSLASVGINFQAPSLLNDTGQLTIDLKALKAAFTADATGTAALLAQAFKSIAQLAAQFTGIVVQLETLTQIGTTPNSFASDALNVTPATIPATTQTTAPATVPSSTAITTLAVTAQLATAAQQSATTQLTAATTPATTTAPPLTAVALLTDTEQLAATALSTAAALPTATGQLNTTARPAATGLPTTTSPATATTLPVISSLAASGQLAAMAQPTVTALPTLTMQAAATSPLAATSPATIPVTTATASLLAAGQLITVAQPTATALPTTTAQPTAATSSAATTAAVASSLPATTQLPITTTLPATATPSTAPASAAPARASATGIPPVTPSNLVNPFNVATDPAIAAAIAAYHLVDGVFDTGMSRLAGLAPTAFSYSEILPVTRIQPVRFDRYA